MKEQIKKFNEEILDIISKATTIEDTKKIDAVFEKRLEWLNSFDKDNKKKIAFKILESDKELEEIIQNKKLVLLEVITKEDEQNKNREAYKLYE